MLCKLSTAISDTITVLNSKEMQLEHLYSIIMKKILAIIMLIIIQNVHNILYNLLERYQIYSGKVLTLFSGTDRKCACSTWWDTVWYGADSSYWMEVGLFWWHNACLWIGEIRYYSVLFCIFYLWAVVYVNWVKYHCEKS